MESVTLLHARPLVDDSKDSGTTPNHHHPPSWLLVSRAVGGVFLNDNNNDNDNNDKSEEDSGNTNNGKAVGRSEMLLGVNHFQAIPGRPHETLLTTVTHVYSKAIPLMLAERLGVKSAKQFVEDLRTLDLTDDT
jgi:hypothetical protein